MKKPNVPARPIIFSGPMVRALLEGRKTQTRRIVRPQPPYDSGPIECGPYHPTLIDRYGEAYPGDEVFGAFSDDGTWAKRCPYGEHGDLLYVKEAWRVAERYDDKTGSELASILGRRNVQYEEAAGDQFLGRVSGRYRHARFMPRWASRLTLRISLVRMEQVQDISESEALAEGAGNINRFDSDRFGARWFAEMWDSIHGPGSWKSNPFVWVIGFEVIRQNVDALLEAA